MIVRTHRYIAQQPGTGHHQRLHWQQGMFLRHAGHGEALLERRGQNLHLYVEAAYPDYFMHLLQHTLDHLLHENYPGLKNRYYFAVPCPATSSGSPCDGHFKLDSLLRALQEADTHIRCRDCDTRHAIAPSSTVLKPPHLNSN